MVTRFPSAADQWNSGQAILVKHGSGLVVPFNEQQQVGAGYASPAQAESAAAGTFVEIMHPGGPIQITFTDQRYDDNRAPAPPKTTPIFALYGTGFDIENALVPQSSCGYDNGNGTRSLLLTVKNITDVNFTNLTAELLTSDFTVNDNPQTIASINAGQTATIVFNVTLGAKASTGQLRISILGTVWGSLNFDFTPTVIATAVGIGVDRIFCPGNMERVNVKFRTNGFLYEDQSFTIRLGGDVNQVVNWLTCSDQNTYTSDDFGTTPCFISTVGVDVVPSEPTPPSITMIIDWKDGGVIQQTSTLAVPMIWN